MTNAMPPPTVGAFVPSGAPAWAMRMVNEVWALPSCDMDSLVQAGIDTQRHKEGY